MGRQTYYVERLAGENISLRHHQRLGTILFIYVSSVNHLSILDLRDLKVLEDRRIGPQMDSPLCNYDSSSCLPGATLSLTDYVTKIMHVLPDGGLIVCATMKQGICQIRSTDNLSLIRNSSITVAPNDVNATCVSLVDNSGNLFVAATITGDSPYRELFPLLSTREPPNYSIIGAGSLEDEAAVHIRAEYRSRLRIRFVAAFFHEHYVYYVSTQNKYMPNGRPPVTVHSSKLIRICREEHRYLSYGEIEIECRGTDNSIYNRATAASLVGNELVIAFADENAQRSAICIYEMQEIKLAFWHNIDRCRVGMDTVGLPHIGRDSKCLDNVQKSHLPLSVNTCAIGVGGSQECGQTAIYELDVVINAMDVLPSHDALIIIVGTYNASLIQLRGKRLSFSKYEELSIDDASITTVKFLDDRYYLVIAGSKIWKYSISDCERVRTCSECAAEHDLLCGWCFLRGVCSERTSCNPAVITDTCPVFDTPVPSTLSSALRNVSLLFPVHGMEFEMQSEFICMFENIVTKGQWIGRGITCHVPSFGVMAPITEFRKIKFSVASRLKKIISSCLSCMSSPWNCEWCEMRNTCLASHEQCQGGAKYVCPQIDPAMRNRVIMAEDSDQIVAVEMLHISDYEQSNLACRFYYHGVPVTRNASLRKSRLSCEPWNYTLNKNASQAIIQLEVLENGIVLDKSSVMVYYCTRMAPDCSTCLSLDPGWKCAWCDGICQFSIHCQQSSTLQSPDLICGQPLIDTFEPQSGPVEGGTKIEIRGRNLGSSLSEIKGRVFVGNSKCDVIEFEVAYRILCEVGPGTGFGTIHLRLGQTGRRFADSTMHYRFVDPQPCSLYPSFGPLSGGTKLFIYGINLNTGSNTSVLIGSYPCKVLKRVILPSSITCLTSRSDKAGIYRTIQITIDRSLKILRGSFEYRSDPVVKTIHPKEAFQSGGRLITVRGENLNSVLNAKMFVTSANSEEGAVSELSDCHAHNSTLMKCISPRVSLPSDISPSTLTRWPVAFVMDGVQSVLDFRGRIQLSIASDPQFVPFKGVHIQKAEQLLLLEGNRLSLAASSEEYQVFIGASRCIVIVVEAKQLLCRTPQTEPEATDEKGNIVDGNHPLVVVILGSLRYELGFLEYEVSFRISMIRLVPLLFTTAFLLFIAWLFYVLCKNKNRREREYKRIQMKMEELESSVRNECKQAFAELQTDVIDLKMTADNQSIPFHNKTEFCIRILYRNARLNNGLLHNRQFLSSPVNTKSALAKSPEFKYLLRNIQFLLKLVEIVDNDVWYTLENKCALSSLVVGSLLDDMRYCTEVVFVILNHHITLSLKKCEPHIIFRQSGSLAEQIFTVWFTLCFLDSFKDGPGQSVYLLYKALKCQIERGPLDAITGVARYSLNESKLLRRPLDVTTVQLLVIPLESFNQSPILLRALSCDTITQVKKKLLDIIYNNEPFSVRLSVDQFHLECCTIILSDDDGIEEGGIKKLKCLGDYNIAENTVLAMQSAGTNSYQKNCVGNKDSEETSIPEMFLTRLLTSKEMVQKFVDGFMESVIYKDEIKCPPLILFVFHTFDEIASKNNLMDETAVRSWKVNIWILRFWVNILSNIDYVLDVERIPAVDSSLAVIAQTMVDAFSSASYMIGKESPSSKLLFAKDVKKYRIRATNFFQSVADSPRLSAEAFHDYIAASTQKLYSRTVHCTLRNDLCEWITNNAVRLVEQLSTNQCAEIEPREMAVVDEGPVRYFVKTYAMNKQLSNVLANEHNRDW
uniref:Sema domain-containing protein n=1 Tax=Setaria digitata TaxID=48799 RepID=A0A915PVS6_9BILA